VKRAGPGITASQRGRSGAFSSLLDQILHDEDALDALAFAYLELGNASERAELARAVLQDAADPTPALSAMLTVEPTEALRWRLAAWIGTREHVQRAAHVEGTEAEGHACLIQRLPGLEAESLQITWKQHHIVGMEIKPGADTSNGDSSIGLALGDAAERLTPLVWRHIRSGRSLPTGIERFAPFFSPPG
jgi:hypothetical protein